MSPSSPPSSSSPIAYRNSLISTRLFVFFSACVCVCVCDDPRATLPGLSKRRLCLNAAA